MKKKLFFVLLCLLLSMSAIYATYDNAFTFGLGYGHIDKELAGQKVLRGDGSTDLVTLKDGIKHDGAVLEFGSETKIGKYVVWVNRLGVLIANPKYYLESDGYDVSHLHFPEFSYSNNIHLYSLVEYCGSLLDSKLDLRAGMGFGTNIFSVESSGLNAAAPGYFYMSNKVIFELGADYFFNDDYGISFDFNIQPNSALYVILSMKKSF